MVEVVGNLIGVALLVVDLVLVFSTKGWPDNDLRFLIRGYFGSGLLAGIYWLLYLVIFGFTPAYFYVSELAWVAMFAFQMLFVMQAYRLSHVGPAPRLAWVMPVVLLIPTIWYCTSGQALLDIMEYVPMAATGFFSLAGLLSGGKADDGGEDPAKGVYLTCILLMIAHNACWSASMLFKDYSTITNPYHWLEFLVSVLTFVFALQACRFARLADKGGASGR